MDKGYDSESIHRLIREELNADSIIPVRSWKNERVGGIFRREMDEHFDESRYHRRTLVETKFSVLKRKFGGDLKTRKFSNQRKELSCKMIICNLHQFLQFVMIEVFYRAVIFNRNYSIDTFTEFFFNWLLCHIKNNRLFID